MRVSSRSLRACWLLGQFAVLATLQDVGRQGVGLYVAQPSDSNRVDEDCGDQLLHHAAADPKSLGGLLDGGTMRSDVRDVMSTVWRGWLPPR